jgi:PIN domain nuclease of toxin-antitoxin system
MRIENLEIIWGINRQKLKKNADACRIWPLLVIIPKVQDLLVDTDNIVFVSIASLWELQIKKSLNKISLPDDFISQLQENGFELLDINYKHIAKLDELPLIHRDPFDRMLVA